MAKLRVLPHLVAEEDAVDWSTWNRVFADARVPVEDRTDGWDYDQELTFGISPTFDVPKLLESTGLDLGDMELVITADCNSVQQRFMERSPLQVYLATASPSIELSIPPGQVAQELRLTAHLVIAHDVPVDGTQRAVLAGSRLSWSPSKRVVLEGHGGRFPTEAVSFNDLGLESAAWSVRVNVSDLNDLFAGCVRLLLNTDHPVGAGLASMDAAVYGAVGSFLRIDIIRQCILGVGKQVDELGGGWDFSADEDSVGFVVSEMCDYYIGKDLTSVFELVRTDPTRFERVLQERVGITIGMSR